MGDYPDVLYLFIWPCTCDLVMFWSFLYRWDFFFFFFSRMNGCEKCLWIAVLHTLSGRMRRLSLPPRSESLPSLYSSAKCLSFSPLTSDLHVTAVCSTQTSCFTDRVRRGCSGPAVFSEQWMLQEYPRTGCIINSIIITCVFMLISRERPWCF